MFMFRPFAVLAVVALATTACSGVIMTNQLYRNNSMVFFTYAASAGEMNTVVVGDPFPVSRAVLDNAVTAAMQNNHNGPMTHFTTTPGPKAHPSYRIVVAFNPSPLMNGSVMCGPPGAIPTGKTGHRLHADVAFCIESDLYSIVRASIPAVNSPSNPAFHHMIASAMWQLIPSHDPGEFGDGCRGLVCR